MLRTPTALIALLLTASTPFAQPIALDLSAPAGAFADELHPIGWSEDGRYLAFAYRRSGGSAVASRIQLRVQDLASDRLVIDEVLRPEHDVEQEMGDVLVSEQARINVLLNPYKIEPAPSPLRDIPMWEGAPEGARHSVSIRHAYVQAEGYDGPVASTLLRLYAADGHSKEIDQTEYELRPFSVRVVGSLEAPTSDRIAIILEEVRGGFEQDRVYTYRIVGAGVGDRI